MANGTSEAYQVQLNIKLGRGGEPEDFVQIIAGVLKSRLRKSGAFPKAIVTSYKKDSLLVVVGVPREDLEKNLAEQSQKGIIHGYMFGYRISATEVTREQAEGNEIANLEALLEKRDAELELADRRLGEAAAQNNELAGRHRLLEQRLREMQAAATGTKAAEPVLVPFFQVPHEALAGITNAQSAYTRAQDCNFECALNGMAVEKVLELMKLEPNEFLSARLSVIINTREDIIKLLEQQDHSLCKTACSHLEEVERLQSQYGALQSLKYFMSAEQEHAAPKLVYLLTDETTRTNMCTIYLPIGKSDGWLTKQMRDHVIETLIELYGKGAVQSSKDLKVGSVRKISTVGATSEAIKAALESTQKKYHFSRFGYTIKVIVFKETVAQ